MLAELLDEEPEELLVEDAELLEAEELLEEEDLF